MAFVAVPFSPDAFTEQARLDARADEKRHAGTSGISLPARRSAGTLLGWGEAALHDLEWASHLVYTPDQHHQYRTAYAEEYQRVRADRRARGKRTGPPAAHRTPLREGRLLT